MIYGIDDALDVHFALLLVRFLCQPCESLLEVFSSSFGVPRLTIIVLQLLVSASCRKVDKMSAYWEVVLNVRVLNLVLEQVVLVQE